MNSQTLKENGFSEAFPLKELSVMKLPANKNQVFVLVDRTLSEKAASDILYIGQAKNLAKKIFGGYIGCSGGKNVKRIHKALFDEGYIEKITLSWMTDDKPKKAQKDLLNKFKEEHGAYPHWNSPRKKTEKPVVAKPKKVKPQRKAKVKPAPKSQTVKTQRTPKAKAASSQVTAAQKAENPQ
jgi:hypothetical protein